MHAARSDRSRRSGRAGDQRDPLSAESTRALQLTAVEATCAYFEIVRTEADHPNPYLPFFHLRSDGFWTLVAIAGREAQVRAMRTARSHADIQENIDHVELDADLYRYLRDASVRAALRDTLLARWFPLKAAELRAPWLRTWKKTSTN